MAHNQRLHIENVAHELNRLQDSPILDAVTQAGARYESNPSARNYKNLLHKSGEASIVYREIINLLDSVPNRKLYLGEGH